MSKTKLVIIAVLLFLVVMVDFRVFLMSLLADAVFAAGIWAVLMYWPDDDS